MAVQEWTVFAIVGPTAVDLERVLAKSAKARQSRDPDMWSPVDWPKPTRVIASRVVRDLERERLGPPIVFFSKHVDLWSSLADLYSFIPEQPPAVAYGNNELWSYRLPDRGKLLRRIRAENSRDGFEEHRWLSRILESAASAHKPFWRDSLILIRRNSMTASPTDEQLRAAGARRLDLGYAPASPPRH